MRLKPAILSVLDRDDLKHVVDAMEIDGVDRRSGEAMRAALSRARRVKAEDLLSYVRKDQLTEVCELVGVVNKGKKQELVDRLRVFERQPAAKRTAKKTKQKGTSMVKGESGKPAQRQKELPLTYERENGKKLDVSALESWLWEAAC